MRASRLINALLFAGEAVGEMLSRVFGLAMLACLVSMFSICLESAPAEPSPVHEQENARSLRVARKDLSEILARPEFKVEVEPETFWDRLQKKIAKAIASFLERLLGSAGAHPGGSIALLWTLVAAAIGAVSWIAYTLWSRETRFEHLASEGPPPTRRAWEEWLAAGKAAADRGDGRTAIQLAYWAGVARLQQDGRLPKDRPRTPREYLQLAAAPAKDERGGAGFAEPLSILTGKLERFWYGRRAAGSEEFSACLTLLEALGCTMR